MRILSLALKNIRSYADAELKFPDGLTLFEGDIGSGKSTILYAIEFALFGGAEARVSRDSKPEDWKKSDFYLRTGEKKGWVRLEIEVGGKEYSILRELARSGGAICKIISDGVVTEYAPTEMRKKVLEILGFNEPPSTRSASVIYRYAVFTPQEDMKEILRMKEDDRVQTLRKVFRIEEYKTARENARLAASDFRSRSGETEDTEREMEEDRIRLKETEKDRAEKLAAIKKDEEELEKAESSLQAAEKELARTEKLREERDALARRAGELRARFEGLEDELRISEAEMKGLGELERRLEALRPNVEEDRLVTARLEELEERLEERHGFELKLKGLTQEQKALEKELSEADDKRRGLESLGKNLEALRKELEEYATVEDRLATQREYHAKLQEKVRSLQSDIDELEAERDGYESLESGKKCPKCKQDLNEGHLKAMIEDVEKKMAVKLKGQQDSKKKVEAAESRVRDIKLRLSDLQDSRDEHNKLEGREKSLKEDVSGSKEAAKRLEAVRAEQEKLGERMKASDAKDEVERLRAGHKERDARMTEFTALEGRVSERRKHEAQVARRREELERQQKELAKAETALKEKEKLCDEEAFKRLKDGWKGAVQRVAGLKESIPEKKESLEDLDRELGMLREHIAEKEGKLLEMRRLREASAWLSEFFVPALEEIERFVLNGINRQFEALFRKWFGMLVEGTELDVTIDDNFTPVVNQGGYELDIWALSGGEKTSVALAYRLALNQMVKEVSAAGEGNLLI
ncbi:MAG: AAA family ATPase, partial [Methylacidiphilaceae bacterium]|nr:AAA family ATPase [Candidatus Methylacidiphilaceae bacterium]